LKQRILAALLSSSVISCIYLISEYGVREIMKEFSISTILVFIAYTALFFLIYLIIATPIQILIEKWSAKSFSIPGLFILLTFSFIFHYLFYHFFNDYQPFFENPDIFFSIFATAFIYWMINSLVELKRLKAT
jgi:Uncharacterised protein family (UPF0715)